jgi:hypothetical protein
MHSRARSLHLCVQLLAWSLLCASEPCTTSLDECIHASCVLPNILGAESQAQLLNQIRVHATANGGNTTTKKLMRTKEGSIKSPGTPWNCLCQG